MAEPCRVVKEHSINVKTALFTVGGHLGFGLGWRTPRQSEPTDLTGYVNLFLSRTGIRMPVRLELYRQTYACATGVIQAYICLYDWSYTGIHMHVRLGLDRHTYACTTRVRQAYILQPISGQNNFLNTHWLKYVCLYNPSCTGIRMQKLCMYNSSRTGIRMPV